MVKVFLKYKSLLFQQRFLYQAFVVGVLLANVVSKAKQYYLRSFFWSDEIKLASNILNRGYLQFFEPLSDHQVAPPFFMMAIKFVVALFGDYELVFRGLPFLASILSPYFFYLILRKEWNPFTRGMALLLFCTTPILLRYASEFKPYSTDVFFSLIAYYLFITRRESFSVLFLSIKFLFLIFMPLLSIPSFFILIGIVAQELFSKERKKVIMVLLFFGMMAWFICYFFYYAEAKHTLFMENFWASRVGTIGDSPMQFLEKNLSNFKNIFIRGFAFGYAWPMGMFFFFFGMIRLFLQKRSLGLALFIPLFLTLIFSIFNRYPFYMRMILFLFPSFTIAIILGINVFLESRKFFFRTFGIIFFIILWSGPLHKTVTTWITPFQQNQTEELFRYLRDAVEKNDKVYVYYRTRYEWEYYWKKASTQNPEVILGNPLFTGEEDALKEIRRLSKKGRVWLVFSRCYFSDLRKIKKLFDSYLNLDQECQLRFQGRREFAYVCDF